MNPSPSELKARLAAARAANDEAQIERLEDQANDLAYETACERDSPNSYDLESIKERIYEQLTA